MKLYEFKLRDDSIAVNEYEVKETEKLYIVQKNNGHSSYISYSAYSRVPKDIVDSGKVLHYMTTMFYYSISNDFAIAMDMFILHLDKNVIPSCNEKIKKATEEKEKYDDMLKRLLNKANGTN